MKSILDTAMELVASNFHHCENNGICLNCGHVQDGCEPDARNYKCEACGENKVFGAEEAVVTLMV
jgi:hypothetical protein